MRLANFKPPEAVRVCWAVLMVLCVSLVACHEDQATGDLAEDVVFASDSVADGVLISQDSIADGVPPDSPDVLTTGGVETELELVYEQLAQGQWAPYMELRAGVAWGLRLDELSTQAQSPVSTIASRTAAGALERRLLEGVLPEAVANAVVESFRAILQDGETPALMSTAIRALGRSPRGAHQDLLVKTLQTETDVDRRLMLLFALGDQADAQGLDLVTAQFDSAVSCAERRAVAIAYIRASEAAVLQDRWDWLGDTVAPVLVDCANEGSTESLSAADHLRTLAQCFDRPASTTLVDLILTQGPSDGLAREAFRILGRAPDASLGYALNEARVTLQESGLWEQAASLIATLSGEE